MSVILFNIEVNLDNKYLSIFCVELLMFLFENDQNFVREQSTETPEMGVFHLFSYRVLGRTSSKDKL